jgi:hypothetical protein
MKIGEGSKLGLCGLFGGRTVGMQGSGIGGQVGAGTGCSANVVRN